MEWRMSKETVTVVEEAETASGGRKIPLAGDGAGLYAKGLTKVYRRRTVVNKVSVQIAPGEIVGLLGPNGAGKTTSFYLILGLVTSDGGRVVLDNRDITKLPMYLRARRGIGYLPQ